MTSVGMPGARQQLPTAVGDDDPAEQSSSTTTIPPSIAAVDAAWATLIEVVDELSTSPQPQRSSSPDASTLAVYISTLREANQGFGGGLLEVLRGYVLSVLDRDVRDEVAPHFWSLVDPEAGGRDGDEAQRKKGDGVDEDEEELGSCPQRQAYGRVKCALLFVADKVQRHLALVRLLDQATALSRAGARMGVAVSANGGPSSIEARYRCAFTAQVMTRATGSFHSTMRAFFDRNLRFWHRSWLDEKKQERRQGRKRRRGAASSGDDKMDVSDDDEAAAGDGTDAEVLDDSAVLDDGEDEGGDEGDDDDGNDDDFADMNLEELLRLWGVLRRLGWFSLLQDAFSSVMFSHVLAYVKRRCDGIYDTPVLDDVIAWKNEVLLRWIALLLHGGQEQNARNPIKSNDMSQAQQHGHGESKEPAAAPKNGGRGDENNATDAAYGWSQRLGLAVHEAFCSARIAELFDIIADYPDSAVAVGELKTALGVTQQHKRLAVLLRESVRRRLLHPGANTHQIIDVYIATIKVLRVLDPKDILLETVAGPVRTYLQGRKDTVRCIVASLTDETSGDLYEELRRQGARPLDRDDGSEEDDDGPVAPNWEPASRDADPASGSRGGGDILTMLVSIYGSKELFVTEYRLMLADKLVNNLTYDTDREVQNLELLKLRFGESSLHQCEIMVRDLEESKRVNANVHDRLARRLTPAQKDAAKSLDAVMVSQHFWPQLLGEEMKLHPSMEKKLGEFGKAYSVIKNPRLLVWKKQLGVVQLTLQFGDTKRDFSVSPLHATLIMHFEGKSEFWTLSGLAKEVGLPTSLVQKKMMLWVNQGIVSEASGPAYRLVRDQAQAKAGSEGVDLMAMEDNTEAAVSADANDAEADKVIEQYLTGMLTNLGKLPLNRIHNTLKMFMSGGDNKYDKSIQELSQLLFRLCNDGKLEQIDGEYRLVA